MSDGVEVSGTVSSRVTRMVLAGGSILSAICFVAAIALEVAGRPAFGGDALGWATMGVIAVILTPVAGLFATAYEYRGRQESWVAAGVLSILAASLAIALLR